MRRPLSHGRWAVWRGLARILVCLCASRSIASPADWLRQPWHAYQTTNFVLYTDLDDAAARRSIEDIERFAVVVQYLVGLRRQNGPIPVEFWLLSDPAMVAKLAGDYTLLGFMRPSPRASYIVATAAGLGGESANNVMLHEYVHLLVRAAGGAAEGIDLPRWYDEGLAEFLATLRVRDGVVRVGLPNRPRVSYLRSRSERLLPLGVLLETADLERLPRERVAEFYALSWALVHWLHAKKHPNFGAADAPPGHPLIKEYLQRVSRGDSPRVVAREVFGSDLRSLEDRVREHADDVRQAPLLRLPVTQFPLAVQEVAVRRLSEYEAAYRLGYVALGDSGETAREFFRLALAIRPNDLHATMGLAVADQFDRKFSDAIAQAQRVLAREGAAADVLLLQEYADMQMEWCDSDQPPDDCAVRRSEIISLYERILALQPGRIEAHAAIAGILLDAQRDPQLAQHHLRIAATAMPWSMPVVLQSARAALLAGDSPTAETLFARAVRWVENAQARRRLERVAQEFACVRALPERITPQQRWACAGSALATPAQ